MLDSFKQLDEDGEIRSNANPIQIEMNVDLDVELVKKIKEYNNSN